MIWARPLLRGESSACLWARAGLDKHSQSLLQGGLEWHALLTGLETQSKEEVGNLVGAAWVGGADDAAIIRYSRLAVERWLSQLAVCELRTALARLVNVTQGPMPTPLLNSTRLEWGRRTRIMGIVNVTPDSFSDGGMHADARGAVQHGLALADAGADVLDIGGESTRPGSLPVSEEEELQRVIPVLEGLRAARGELVLSIDTQKPAVARAAVQAGAQIINDVSGLSNDAMLEVVAATGACACAMHMVGSPETMQRRAHYDDVGAEVLDALENALLRAERCGVPRERIWVDPGIGFGKTPEHNLFLLRRAADLRLLGVPILIGVSRKAFLGTLLGGKEPHERVGASAAAAAILCAEGSVDVMRVHDVAATRDALAVGDALRFARGGGARFHS